MGPFLFTWMISGEVYGKSNSSGVTVDEFMGLLTNVVKFNCSFLDDDVLGGIIQYSFLGFFWHFAFHGNGKIYI